MRDASDPRAVYKIVCDRGEDRTIRVLPKAELTCQGSTRSYQTFRVRYAATTRSALHRSSTSTASRSSSEWMKDGRLVREIPSLSTVRAHARAQLSASRPPCSTIPKTAPSAYEVRWSHASRRSRGMCALARSIHDIWDFPENLRKIRRSWKGPRNSVKIAIARKTNSTVGDVEGNARRIGEFTEHAHRQGASSSCSRTGAPGYPPLLTSQACLFRGAMPEQAETSPQLRRALRRSLGTSPQCRRRVPLMVPGSSTQPSWPNEDKFVIFREEPLPTRCLRRNALLRRQHNAGRNDLHARQRHGPALA